MRGIHPSLAMQGNPPVVILTSTALKLRHTPIGDCAAYED